jgi:histidine phosphotransfer protein HptB
MFFPSAAVENGKVMASERIPVLDREQLSEITLEDEDLMRQLLAALIEDTEQQMPLLEAAIQNADSRQCARLAHYCKGACSNMGAKAAADVLTKLEAHAKFGELAECGSQLQRLAAEVDRLKMERV